jgi:hypothetical protein
MELNIKEIFEITGIIPEDRKVKKTDPIFYRILTSYQPDKYQ